MTDVLTAMPTYQRNGSPIIDISSRIQNAYLVNPVYIVDKNTISDWSVIFHLKI